MDEKGSPSARLEGFTWPVLWKIEELVRAHHGVLVFDGPLIGRQLH
jgi:hypothetical protein